MIISELFEAPQMCPECGGISFSDLILAEKKDACYHKVKASAKVWPSAYASGRLVQCRKKGAANYGNKSEGVMENNDPYEPEAYDEFVSDTYSDDNPEDEQGVAEGMPADNDMGSTTGGAKMTLGQWKQMWMKKMPNADFAAMFRSPPNMRGSAIAYFDGWVNNPDARWDPQQGVAEGAPVTTTTGSINPGGAVDNFKQQMANNTEVAYQKKLSGVGEGEQQKGADYRDPKEVDYDDEYDAMVARVRKLAGLGPMKTVYDPAKRQYRNMPTAVQPKK
jgi:hypothetical protein